MSIATPAFRSLALSDIPSPDYLDMFAVPLPPGATRDPEAWVKAIFSSSAAPRWIGALLALRQAVVPLIGVQPAPKSIFDVDRVEGDEALITVDDRHLDFRCGVGVDADLGLVRLTTVVRLKGWRGRVYFAPVRLLHPMIVLAMMRGAARHLR